MSNISEVHSIEAFDSKKSQALSGQRLAKIGYKQTEAMTRDGKKALPSICVSVPPMDTAVVLAHSQQLLPYIVAMCEAAQDDIIRGLNDASNGTLREVTDSQIDMAAILQQLAAKQEGERLTKEKIAAWCESSNLADALRLRFAELLGVSDTPSNEENARIEAQVKQYKEMFSALAGSKTYYEEKQAKLLAKALDVAAAYSGEIAEDALYCKFSARIQEMIQNPKTADLLAL